MKNIILLPTDKPSKLFYAKKGEELCLGKSSYYSTGQHIYIISDEEIKVGDYFIESLGLPDSYLVHKLSKEWKDKESFYRRCTKVILTTDADLIEDRVESIDDEFLEWFVKNPNCEEVEIHNLRIKNQETGEIFHYRYEIDTPKKEPKQKKWDKLNKEFDSALDSEFGSEEPKQEPCDNCGNEICCCILKKQETLEGLVGKMKITDDKVDLFAYSLGLKEGAKWQSERMYSEEEVKHIVSEALESALVTVDLEQWFEQFKKK